MSVTETKPGTITEPDGQQSPEDEVKTPENVKVSSKTYTEKELRDAVKAAEGRAAKQLQKQAEEFKSQVEEATTAKEETLAKVADLEADLEQAIGEDADLLDIKKIKTDLRTERDNLRKEVKDEKDAVAELRKSLETEREEWAETVAEAQTFKFDGELARVVDEYDGDTSANFTKLKRACEKAGVKTKEGAEAIAETFLTKKGEEPDLLNDSGINSGGSEDLNNLSSRELFAKAYTRKKR